MEQAEAVLREQQERSLSPSSDPSWADETLVWTVSLTEFEEGLECLLTSLCSRPGRWILVAEDAARPNHFWQALAFEDGSLVTEIVSNHYLSGNDRWTGRQEAELVALGWERPDPPRRPNWTHVEYTTSPEVAEVAAQAVESMRRVFGLDSWDRLNVKLFSSPNRGNTPASPEYVGDDLPSDIDVSPSDRLFVRVDPDTCNEDLVRAVNDALDRVFGPVRDTPEERDPFPTVHEWTTRPGRCIVGGHLIDPFGGPDEPDPDLEGDDPEVGPDQMNGPSN